MDEETIKHSSGKKAGIEEREEEKKDQKKEGIEKGE